MKRHLLRFNQLPRAARWAILGGLVIALYFAVVEPVLDLKVRYDTAGAASAAKLAKYREQFRRAEAAEAEIALGVTRFGMVALPSPSSDASQALLQRIEGILRPLELSKFDLNVRKAVPLGGEAFAELFDPSLEVQRLVVDLELEASPEVMMQVISDLERAPEVTTVGRISIRRTGRDGQRLVQATIAPESWVLAERRSTR